MFMQDNMTIAQDEIFGPVMALMKFKYICFFVQHFLSDS
jgi:acyl-CoA reductase-like NAD-dependent aldehyde dehydrogenase